MIPRRATKRGTLRGSVSTIRAHNYKSATLEQYQSEIAEIWPLLRTRPALHTWLRVVKHATAACEGVRRSEWRIVLEEIATTIVWWLAFIKKLNLLCRSDDDEIVFAIPVSASKLIWNKYPWVCPVEFALGVKDDDIPSWDDRPGRKCTCLARKEHVEVRPKGEKRRAMRLVRCFADRNDGNRPTSMTDFEHMLREVFSGPVRTLSVQEICLHFMEEVGEVSQALADATVSEAASRRRTRVARFAAERTEKTLAMAEELADVFSWAGSLLAKVKLELVSFEEYFKGRADPGQVQRIRRILAGARELNFADMIWQKYGLRFGELRCSVCGGRPCSCSDQNQRPLQGESLSRFKDRIRAALQGFG